MSEIKKLNDQRIFRLFLHLGMSCLLSVCCIERTQAHDIQRAVALDKEAKELIETF